MDETMRELIYKAIDQTISESEFERLQDAIEQDPEVCREYLRSVGLVESLTELALSESIRRESTKIKSIHGESASYQSDQMRQAVPVPTDSPAPAFDNKTTTSWLSMPLAIAATALIVAGVSIWVATGVSRKSASIVNQGSVNLSQSESKIAGHATLRRTVDLKWSDPGSAWREGDVVPNGPLRFDEGLAEIDFFCGATLIVEGPASLEIESDWSVRVLEGRLRASVPPAARGFVVKTDESEIVDLGTEFAVDVGLDHARVKVIDGEVQLRGGTHAGKHLITGEGLVLKGEVPQQDFVNELSSGSDLGRRRDDAQLRRRESWKEDVRRLREDERLIAYYPISQGLTESQDLSDRIVANVASTGSAADGLLVGPVERTIGRFGLDSIGLKFNRSGARVRTRIDGQFQAFTFVCWVRIDSLQQRYSALFMGDGYENGEPHWQIRNDGRLMFSVMVDDAEEVRHYSPIEQRMVKDAGRHRVYYTEPFWDITNSGQWFHLASVFDPAGREVRQYIGGELVSQHVIEDQYHIKELRIGPAEIGNWGQPFRESPWFAVRNLNGLIDELAIFNAALSTQEIQRLYQQGKPLGY